MDKLKKELSYLEQKVKEESKKSRSGKTPVEERVLLEKSVMYRQARISEIKNQLQGLTKDDLKLERKIGSQYNNTEKSYRSRSAKSSSAGWNFKKDEYWSN